MAASEMKRISIALTTPGNNRLQKRLFNITLKFSTVHGSGNLINERNSNSYLFVYLLWVDQDISVSTTPQFTKQVCTYRNFFLRSML